MAKVKLNSNEIDEIKSQLQEAEEVVLETRVMWEDNFYNLYNNIVTNGFLDSLYEDAKSDFYNMAGAGYFASYTAAGTGIGVAAGSFVPGIGNAIGGVIGAALGAIFGIFKAIDTSTTKFSEDSKKVFENLLKECKNKDQDAYRAIKNLETKHQSVRASLLEIETKINEFQQAYASLKESAKAVGVKTKMASDGVTVLDTKTSVTIDGKEYKLSVSEAMNAFFTYETTVMSSRLQAQYMKEKYGVDINYEDIVKNANGFMAKTIKSDLYTHTFVEHILPEYNVDKKDVIKDAAGDLGLTTKEFKSILEDNKDVLKNVGVSTALVGALGASYIGKVNSINSSSTNSNNSSSSNSSSSSTSSSSASNSNDVSNNGSPSSNNKSDNNTNDKNNNAKDKKNDTKDKKNDDIKEESKEMDSKVNETIDSDTNIELKVPVNNTLPTLISLNTTDKDYDLLARNTYELKDLQEIEQHRTQITNSVNIAFDSQNLDSIKEQLKNYGYSDESITNIVSDRDILITAMLVGDQKVDLAKLATDAAKVDNVENFDTIYDNEPTYESLIDGTESTLLVNTLSNESVKTAKQDLDNINTEYTKMVNETNTLLSSIDSKKQEIDELYARLQNDDSLREQYNSLVEEYNKLVEQGQLKIEELDKLKASVEEKQKVYNETRETFLNDIKSQNDRTIKETSNEQTSSNIEHLDETNTNTTNNNNSSVGLSDSDAIAMFNQVN